MSQCSRELIGACTESERDKKGPEAGGQSRGAANIISEANVHLDL